MPEAIAGIERIVVVLIAAFFAYLGFRLYLAGLTKGESKLSAKSSLGEFAISGTGPGLLFMAFGGAVLIYALATSGVRSTRTEQVMQPTSAAVSASGAPIIRSTQFASSAPAMARDGR